MTILLALLLMTISLPAWGAIYYVSPNGSGTACTEASPCSWTQGRSNATGSDTVRFLDGTYDLPLQGFRTIRNGTSASARLTFESVNPRGAKLRYNGPNDAGGKDGDTLIVEHDNIVIRGFEVICRSSSANYAWDCVQANGTDVGREVKNILFDNLYMHDNGHSCFGCFWATGVELKNSSFDNCGVNTQDNGFGEGMYLSSSSSNRICTLNAHHNIVGRFRGNAVDFKNQTRNVVIQSNIYLDKKTDGSDGLGGGDGDIISQDGGGTATTAAGNYVRDNIVYRTVTSNGHYKASDGHRVDFIGNVLWDWPVQPKGLTKVLNYQSWSPANAVSSANIHCPASDNITMGPDRDQGGTPNAINRPYSECTTRITEILGNPTIASCEVGSVSSTTLVVNFNIAKNGPLHSAGTPGQLAVKYNGADQTESTVTLTGASQAHIIMAQAPSEGETVTVTPAVGAIKNSAYIGGLNCNMPLSTIQTDPGGTLLSPNKIVNGNGVCGSNTSNAAFTCTNNVGTTPGVQSLDQAVFRFYGEHAAEGINPMAPENQNISGSLGAGFRLRIGVRGGGNNAPSRGYELAARACTPGCGSWLKVTSDASVTGVTYQDDQVQEDGTPTTNQLSLGGKTFVAGSFLETPVDTPAVAISTTQQVEWEFSLLIPPENNPVSDGHSIEFRIKYGDGTDLPSYSVVPTVTMGSASSGITGTFTGRLQ